MANHKTVGIVGQKASSLRSICILRRVALGRAVRAAGTPAARALHINSNCYDGLAFIGWWDVYLIVGICDYTDIIFVIKKKKEGKHNFNNFGIRSS